MGLENRHVSSYLKLYLSLAVSSHPILKSGLYTNYEVFQEDGENSTKINVLPSSRKLNHQGDQQCFILVQKSYPICPQRPLKLNIIDCPCFLFSDIYFSLNEESRKTFTVLFTESNCLCRCNYCRLSEYKRYEFTRLYRRYIQNSRWTENMSASRVRGSFRAERG